MTDNQRLVEEIAYWRADAAARLWGATADYSAAIKAGDVPRAIGIKVGQIDPTLYAFRDADAGHFRETCEGCGQPVRHGQAVIHYEDAGAVHADCDNPDAPGGEGSTPYDDMFTPERVAEIIAKAKALDDDDVLALPA